MEEVRPSLEMIMDEEKRAMRKKKHLGNFLKAFGLRHIATVAGLGSRCAIQLPTERSASSSFCRKPNAIALVEKGSGELIQFISTEGLCSSRQGVPRDRGFIASQHPTLGVSLNIEQTPSIRCGVIVGISIRENPI